MAGTIDPKGREVLERTTFFGRLLSLVQSLGTVDPQQRQRITIDAITAGVALPTVTSVTTVTTVTTVTSVTTVASVTNIAALAGEGVRQFEVYARQSYSVGIRGRLTFT